jgi:hypothetical protein
MSPGHRALCMVGLALVAQLRWRAAHAEVRAEAIALEYSAPEGCATVDEFLARVRERAPVDRVDTGAARTFEVTIELSSTGTHGVLAIRTPDGFSEAREVDGQSCDETISALVVVAALAIVAGNAPVTTVAPVSTVARPSTSPRVLERWVAVGTGLAAYQGVVPANVFGVPVFVALGQNRGPRLRIGFARTQQSEVTMSAGTTEFRWTTGRIDLTPLTLRRGRFDVSPAIGVEAGVIHGRGTTTAMPASASRPWFAPDLAVRARVLIDRFALELEGTLAVPVVRDRFFIAPGTTVHEVPRVTTGVGLTLSVGFW